MAADFMSGMFVREPAWHREGLVLDDYPKNWEEARKFAGLEWEPVLEPMYAKEVIVSGGEPLVDYVPIQGFNQVRRSDTGAVLACPRDSFELIYHSQMGELLEAFTAQTNLKFDTTVCLQGGRKVAAVVRLDEPFQITGDSSLTYPYAVLLNSHDGEGACKLTYTNVRVVCMNTFNAADAQSERHAGTSVVLRHTKNVQDRMEAAKQAVKDMRSGAAAWQELSNELLGYKTDMTIEMEFINSFIPMPPEGVISDRVARNIEEARDAVWQCLYSTTVNEEIRGTGYALVQAAGEYLDHLRGYRNKETYLGRTLLKPEPLKARAVKLVRELAS